MSSTVGKVSTGQHQAEIAFDLAYSFYLANGATVPDAVAACESLLNEVDYVYAQKVEITYTITDIIVRTAQYYPPEADCYDAMQSEWNTNQTGIQRDVAHLLRDTGGPGGAAATGVVCDIANAYGCSSGGSLILAHEIGHNWNSMHCHDYVPCNFMCIEYCLDFAPKTEAVVEAFRDSLTCLDNVGAHPDPLPPHADPDIADFTRDEIDAGGASRTLDVLLNDLDGNMNPLEIDDFDLTSVKGGTVALSPGTGAGGNDELIYTAPSTVFPGNDRFHYTLGDTTGLDTVGDVALRVAATGLLGYWKLDGTADDSSGGRRDGTVSGGAVYVTGAYGQALQFDGVNNYVTIAGLKRDLRSVTISAWLKRSGSQNRFAGIVLGSSPNGIASINFGFDDELRYQWADDPAASGWNSGLVVPDLQWVLVALVVDPAKATLYLHDGTTLHSAENVMAHPAEDFNSQIILGWDPTHISRKFIGQLDEVRIYNHALTASEIAALHDLGGTAYAHDPPDGGGALPGSRELAWSPGLDALSHDVYFGEDFAAVRDATPASPEYRGNTTATAFISPPPQFADAAYYWRVDEVTAGGVVPGHVRVFAVGLPLARWTLDETSGTTAVDVAGGADGTYLGGPLLDLPPAQPELGRAVYLDGVDDAVEVPPLNLDANELTFTAWARRSGTQQNDAAIISSRSASSNVVLNVSPGGDLRYKWNDIGFIVTSEFESTDLTLSNGIWSFVALVIEQYKTTVYLGEMGVLTSDTDHRPNSFEEFDGPLYLGKDAGLGTYFRGYLDDVRIYRYAMSPTQVATLFAEGVGAGLVPDGADVPGTQLLLEKSGGDVSLSWSASCIGTDSDYAVYEGEIGDFTSHIPATCSTDGTTSAVLTPQSGDRYFLVVPQSSNREGGYGSDSASQPRTQSEAACSVQYAVPCP